jgi:type I restriction enzyme M protein
MTVLRRLDALLEDSKEKVMEEVRFQREEMSFTELESAGLREASGYVFYNTSEWTLKKLHDTATNNQQILLTNFEDYLNGFSPNVLEIISEFGLKKQVRHMANNDILLDVLEKFTSPDINLTPHDKEDSDGRKLPGLSNLGMGYVFEELIRKFNEENNEEAGEHFTPREVIELMTYLVFDPVKDDLPPVMTIYDPACGSGGMLTESENFLKDGTGSFKAKGDVYLYGREVQPETYAICKSDMMIKGDDPENIRKSSTIGSDEFAGTQFDFMLSNPPYGKSWKSDLKYVKDGKDVIDPRFIVHLSDYFGNSEEEDAIPRSSDGQLLFMMEMVDKMKSLDKSPRGSRIASIHNGSSLFTGDAGSGESNIRRHIIENDLLEAVVQLPNNLFYNTGITTYLWLLSNKKKENRKGKVILIDASERYAKLRKNLGNKNCEFKAEHIKEILEAYKQFETVERDQKDELAAQVFDNEDFGYYKVTIERPERLKAQFTDERIAPLRFDKTLLEPMEWAYSEWGEDVYTNIDKYAKELSAWVEKEGLDLNKKKRSTLLSQKLWTKHKELYDMAQQMMKIVGQDEYDDFNVFTKKVDKLLKEHKLKPSSSEKKTILSAISWYDEDAAKVIKKKQKLSDKKLNELMEHFNCENDNLPHYGYYPGEKPNEYIVYETSSDLRDYENVPLKEDIHAYYLREVHPHVQEAWIHLDKTKIGYEISFNKYFYQHEPLRSIEEVTQDILELEKESDGLMAEILNMD